MEAPATHVLLIGVGDYPHGVAFGISALRSPLRSVDALHACFASTQDAVSFGARPLKQIVCVSGIDATFERLSAEVWAWIERLKSHDGNLGIVYVAGHGTRVDGADILLCADFGKTAHRPWAGAANLTTTWQAVLSHVPGDVLMLVDVCRSTPLCELPNAAAMPLVDPPKTAVVAHGYCQVFATREGNDAYGHRDGHSWFADAVLGTLRGHEAIADPARPGTWHIDTNLFEKTVTDLLAQEARVAGYAQLAVRNGSLHFPLVELCTPPRIETIRRQLDLRRRFGRLFADLTASKCNGALPREDANGAIADLRHRFGSGTLWVLGPPGSGKSTALAFVASTNAESLVVYFSRTEGLQSLQEARAYVLAAIETWLTEEGRQVDGLARWNYLSGDHARLLVIDGLDEADGSVREPADLGLPARLPAGLVVVIGWRGLERPAFASVGAQVDYRLSQDNTVQLEIVAQYVRAGKGLADPLLAETERIAQGNFLFARLMLDMAQSHPSDFARAKSEASRSHEVFALVALERAVSTSCDDDLAAHVLGAIAAAAEPVDTRVIAAMIEGDAYAIDEILRELGQGLIGARHDGNRTLWRFEHDVFEACAYRRFGGRKIETRMVDAFASGKWGRLEHGGYAARWRSHHLRKLGRLRELEALVLDRDWIESQLRIDPSGRLVLADLEHLDAAVSPDAPDASLGSKFALAVIRGSVQSWWAIGDQQPTFEDLIGVGIIGTSEVMRLLLQPERATIDRLAELLPLCDAGDRHEPVKQWLHFAGPLQEANERRTILQALIPYLAPDDLAPWFEELRKFIDQYDDSADLLCAAVAAHDAACLPQVERFWSDHRDAAREGIVRFLRRGTGSPRVQQELAELLLEDAKYAGHVQTAMQTKLRIDRTNLHRERWALIAVENAMRQNATYSFDELFAALGDDFPREQLRIMHGPTPQRLRALLKCTSRPSRFDTAMVESIRALAESGDRIEAWKDLLLTSDTDFRELAMDLLQEVPALDTERVRASWLVAALCLLENSDVGEQETALAQQAREIAAIVSISSLLEIGPLYVQRRHEATAFVVELVCREAMSRKNAYAMLKQDWWKFAPLIADDTVAATLIAAFAVDERPDNLRHPAPLYAARGLRADRLNQAARIAAGYPNRESALHALLYLACLGSSAAYEAMHDLELPTELHPTAIPEWHWRVMIEHLESVIPVDRRSTLLRIRSTVERLAVDGGRTIKKSATRHDALDLLLTARRQRATELLAAMTRPLLRCRVLDGSRIRQLQLTPVLLKGSLNETWQALGGDDRALRELVSWQVGTPVEIHDLLWVVANGENRQLAQTAFALRDGLGEALEVPWWELGLKIGAIDLDRFATYVNDEWVPNSWSSRLDQVLEAASQFADTRALQCVWDREWSIETRIGVIDWIGCGDSKLRAWILSRLPDDLARANACPALLKNLRDLIQSLEGEPPTPSLAAVLMRLHTIERCWAGETGDERWQVSRPEPPPTFPMAELEHLEREVQDGRVFTLNEVRYLFEKAAPDAAEIRRRLAAIAARTDLWQVDQYLYQCVAILPQLEGDALTRVRRKLVDCFLFERACRVEAYRHVWFAAALSTLIDENERSLCETALINYYSPSWAAEALMALGGDAVFRRRAREFTLSVAMGLLEIGDLRDSVETLKMASIDDIDLRHEVIDYLRRLAASGMQLAAVDALRYPAATKLALVHQCGSDSLLADFLLAHLSEAELVEALTPADLLVAVTRLASMDFASASRSATNVLAALLPHIDAAEARLLFDTVFAAWLGTAAAGSIRRRFDTPLSLP